MPSRDWPRRWAVTQVGVDGGLATLAAVHGVPARVVMAVAVVQVVGWEGPRGRRGAGHRSMMGSSAVKVPVPWTSMSDRHRAQMR